MTKPITSVNDIADQIADEAIDQLAAAVQTIIQLEALFRACRKELGVNSDAGRLVALGEYAAMDQGNGFDCHSRDTEGAPQQLRATFFAIRKRGAGIRRSA
ncbi:hypothetical protein K2E95_01280 [Pseudomonas sp. ERGC3:01]|nr:hypothetical protein [Pseudomonas sp. ERGC3:01]